MDTYLPITVDYYILVHYYYCGDELLYVKKFCYNKEPGLLLWEYNKKVQYLLTETMCDGLNFWIHSIWVAYKKGVWKN